MDLLMKNGGHYEIFYHDEFVAEIRKICVPQKNGYKRRKIAGIYTYCNDVWIMRFDGETYKDRANPRHYKSLKDLLINNFPNGFDNKPGPLKILKKVYGK